MASVPGAIVAIMRQPRFANSPEKWERTEEMISPTPFLPDRIIPEEGSIVTELARGYQPIAVPFDAPAREHLERFIGPVEALHCKQPRLPLALWFAPLGGAVLGRGATAPLPAWEPNPIWLEFMAQPPGALNRAG